MGISLIATIAALSAGCGSEPPTAPSPPQTFTLTGMVMEARAEVRTPARNIPVEISGEALVQARPNARPGEPTLRTFTDSAGNFSIRDLAEGTYVLHVRGPFHEPLSTTIQIQGDTRIDLEIVPLPIYELSGIVYEDTEDGPIPVPGVYVNNSDIHSSARTDDAGAYRVAALRGDAQISFSKSGYVDQWRTIVMEADVRLDVKLVRR